MSATYEKILSAVLDDPTLTDAEARLLLYLARRPPGWVVLPAVVARDIKRNERYWVRPTLRLLQARGFLTAEIRRGEHAQFAALTYRVQRDELIAPTGEQNLRSEPATVKQSTVPPAETPEEHLFPQVEPQAVSQSTVPPAETQKARSDRGLSDGAPSDNRRERTDSKKRTKDLGGTSPADTLKGTLIPADFGSVIRQDPHQTDWLRTHCPLLCSAGRVPTETGKMVRHFESKAGVDARKRSWVKTWQNWMVRAEDDLTNKRQPFGTVQPGADGYVQPVSPFRDL